MQVQPCAKARVTPHPTSPLVVSEWAATVQSLPPPGYMLAQLHISTGERLCSPAADTGGLRNQTPSEHSIKKKHGSEAWSVAAERRKSPTLPASDARPDRRGTKPAPVTIGAPVYRAGLDDAVSIQAGTGDRGRQRPQREAAPCCGRAEKSGATWHREGFQPALMRCAPHGGR